MFTYAWFPRCGSGLVFVNPFNRHVCTVNRDYRHAFTIYA